MNQAKKSLERLFIGGFFVFALSEAAPIFPAEAQITPDSTLGAERSRLDSNVLINNVLGDKINGGAIRDRNLFHSFSEFNINDGQRVYFSNPSGVLNILTRVTGGNASSILGTLGVDGNANLFLMNPNGIFFGKNASLDVRSSFVGTTANGLQFGNQGVFSATNPQVAPLLTVNPSALVFSQVQANAGITNLSQAPAGIDLTGQNITGLRVPDGKNLLMIGGDINIDGGAIRSYGGRIELASLAAPGAVELNNTFSLSIPNDIKRGNIFLTNGAEVNVRGADAGNIFINAQNLNIAEQSKIRAGIDIGLGTSQAKAGDININSTGTTTLSNDSFLANVPQRTSIGKGGNINITTGLLELLSGSVLNANIFGQGDGGNINITAGSVSLTDGASVNARNFGRGNVGNISIQAQNAVSLNNTANILSNVESGGIGKGGNINITASSLDIKNGSQIQAGIRGTDIQNNLPGGRGSAGNINIDVGGAIAISGIKDGFAAAIFGDVEAGAEGNGGNINIKAGSFYLLGSGSFLNTNTAGKGNSGNIFVQAANLVSLDNSGIFSDVDATGVGNAGSIEIKTGSLSLTNGAELNTKTFGQGNSGSIRINARDGIILEGKSATSDVRSRIISAVNPEAVGNAGDIELTTGNLAIGNEAFISSSTLGKGNAANIIINARNISIGRLSTIQSSIFPGGVGKGGNIQVDTDTLSLTNGGQINTNVLGIGDAGNITINARNSVNIDGVQGSAISGIQSQLLTGTGKGGDIQITTGSFSAKNGASVNASTNAQGDAGNVTINASDTVTFAGFIGNEKDLSTNISTVTSDDSTGKGGDIRVSAKGLFLQSGAFFGTNSFGQGNAGNIIIDTRDRVVVDGLGTNRLTSALSTFASGGNGGNIEITTGDFLLTNGGNLSSFVYRETGEPIQASAGNIAINARNAVTIDGLANNGRSSRIETEIVGKIIGNAGDIRIATKSFSLSNGAYLNSRTQALGNAGNINIDATDNITFTAGSQILATTSGTGKGGNVAVTGGDISFEGIGSDRRSGIFTIVNPTGTGKGGDINVNARNLFVSDGAALSSSSLGQGNAGDININSGNVRLDQKGIIAAQTNFSDGGNIKLTADNYLLLRRGGAISTTAGFAQAGGNGGNMTLNIPFIVAVPGENSDITANAFKGNGGNINITTQGIFGIEPRAQASDATNDITASSQLGVQGQIDINNPEIDPTKGIIELPNEVVDVSNQIGQLCPRGYDAVRKPLSSFTIIGRGALPPSPLEPLSGTTRIPLATLDSGEKIERESRQGRQEIKSSPNSQVIEAQGLFKNYQGEIFLVAQAPQTTPSSQSTVSACPR